MRVAIVGTGISGLTCAHLLHLEHDLTVFEAGDYVGGHTATVDVEVDGKSIPVDTGFIVFNTKTYPNFVGILNELGVAWQHSSMSFSARSGRDGLEYNGTSLNTLFAQRRNIVRPSFWRMVRDIMRFYREAGELLGSRDVTTTLGSYLQERGYSREFVDHHIVPMGAAIWSAQPGGLLEFPARFLVEFFHNHGFLQLDGQPPWLTITGGSREYVRAIVRPFADRIRLRTPVRSLRRADSGVEILTADGGPERFDQVILACHGDQALKLLADPSPAEAEVLSAFRYQTNDTVLHTDPSVMPRRRRAWGSWNYHIDGDDPARANVTYWMNRLQSIRTPTQLFVTLNDTARIDPGRVLRRFTYHHPSYSVEAQTAQRRHDEINGARRTWFAGAYWGYGFHEDGVVSAQRVCRGLTTLRMAA